MTIKKIIPYQILDSRGEPTLLVVMVSDSGKSAKFAVLLVRVLAMMKRTKKEMVKDHMMARAYRYV